MANVTQPEVFATNKAEVLVEEGHGGAPTHAAPELLGLAPYQWVSIAMLLLLLIAFFGAKVHKTITGGLDNKIQAIKDQLDEAKKRYLPERHVIEKNAYYEAFCEYMKSGQVGMKLSDEQIERYYQAQCLKDDAMAESIVNALGKEPHKTVLHLQGEFHGRNRLGVVEKIQKLNPKLRIGLISPVYVKTGTEIENAVHHLAVGDVVLAVNQ